MSLTELLPSIRGLSRPEKLRLIQVLAAELAAAESPTPAPLAEGETYPVWSPYDAHEAAATLLNLLDEERPRP
ncbi:hypothetical protein [Aquisphaera giovannonii]|nr:hypothetical protein [Aquisphaera giovannonii]